MVHVEIIKQVPKELIEDEWNLCFQKVTYYYDEGGSDDGFRFIWRRPDGTLQAARGQARIESLPQMMNPIKLATEEGFFKDETILEGKTIPPHAHISLYGQKEYSMRLSKDHRCSRVAP